MLSRLSRYIDTIIYYKKPRKLQEKNLKKSV